MESVLDARRLAAVALGGFAFVSALLYYGNQTNYLLQGLSFTFVLVGIGVAGLRVKMSRLAILVLWMSAFGTIAAFVVSPSADSSFAVACGLGLIPLAALFGMALGSARGLLWLMIGIIVLVLTIFSAVRLGLDGTRPEAPLTDVNNYGALLYVVLLIHSGRILDLKWGKKTSQLWYPGLLAVVLLTFVIAGTQSRASIFIVLSAAVFFLLYAIRHRLDLRPLLAVVGAGILGVLFHELLIARSSLEGSAEPISGGISVRLTLIEAALAMYREGGVSGIGLAVFPLFYRQVRTALDDDSAGLFVHNDYVQLFVEGGPLLVAPLIVVLSWVGVVLWQFISNSSKNHSPERLGATLALAALLAHAMVNFVFYAPALGLLIGFLVATVLNLPAVAGHNTLRTFPGVFLLPLLLVAGGGCGYLWLDITTSVKLQGQPGIPLVLQPVREQREQLAYARLAQKLNADRGLPFLAEAVLLDKDRSLVDVDAESSILAAYRRAVQVDPWNTFSWWQFRDFILRTESIRDRLLPAEQPSSITLEVLRLDPVFVPAIEGRLAELATTDTAQTRQRQLKFLRSQIGPRLTWLARENPKAAQHYADVLLRHSTSAADHAVWIGALEQISALQPLSPERWFVDPSG